MVVELLLPQGRVGVISSRKPRKLILVDRDLFWKRLRGFGRYRVNRIQRRTGFER
jgi:hypothetical protein